MFQRNLNFKKKDKRMQKKLRYKINEKRSSRIWNNLYKRRTLKFISGLLYKYWCYG